MSSELFLFKLTASEWMSNKLRVSYLKGFPNERWTPAERWFFLAARESSHGLSVYMSVQKQNGIPPSPSYFPSGHLWWVKSFPRKIGCTMSCPYDNTNKSKRECIITSRVKPEARNAPRGVQRSTIARWMAKKERKKGWYANQYVYTLRSP